MNASRLVSEEKAVLQAQKVFKDKTSTNNPSFPSLTMSLSSLNVKSFNALLKILSLCTKPAQMKGQHSLKKKASQLSVLIDYSKRVFCRQLFNLLNGLALALLTPSLYFLLYEHIGIKGVFLLWVYSLEANFNLKAWTPANGDFQFCFWVYFDQEYKKLYSSCQGTRAMYVSCNNRSCCFLFGQLISTIVKIGK